MKPNLAIVLVFCFFSLAWGCSNSRSTEDAGVCHPTAPSGGATLETDTFRYSISDKGKNLSLVAKSTGLNYANVSGEASFASVTIVGHDGGTSSPVTSLTSRKVLPQDAGRPRPSRPRPRT